jgi:hypothetical protein
MAKQKVNKSAAIRELYAKNAKLPVRDAVELLARQGIMVSPNLVYFVLGGSRGKAKRKAGRKRRAAESHQKAGNKTGAVYPLSVITDLMGLAKQAGGVANLKRLLDVLE